MMSAYTLGAGDIAQYCHLLNHKRWLNKRYITLVKEYLEANIQTFGSHFSLNIGIHVLPDFDTLMFDIFVLFEINQGSLSPHVFARREPLQSIPNLILIQGDASLWTDKERFKDINVSNVSSSMEQRQMMGVVSKFLMLLVHTARRMDDGFEGSLNPADVVLLMDKSPFLPATSSVDDILVHDNNHAGFSVKVPNVLQDVLGMKISEINVDEMVNFIMGTSVEQFMGNFIPRIKASGFFPPDMAINDLLRISTDMAKVIAGTVGWYKKGYYEATKTLMRQGFVEPSIDAPHLSPKGRFLRDLLLELGLRNLVAFANTNAQPIGYGIRTPLSEIESMSGGIRG